MRRAVRPVGVALLRSSSDAWAASRTAAARCCSRLAGQRSRVVGGAGSLGDTSTSQLASRSSTAAGMADARSRACAASVVVTILACCVLGCTSGESERDFEIWHNVPFLQGHGPGYDALETPWRVRQSGRSLGTTRTSTSARLPLYVADGGTSSETIHDHTWGSQYRPRANFNRCTSADGPRCLALAEEYENLAASGVRKNAGKGGGSLPAGNGHGSSAIVQLFREYRHVKPPLSAGAIRQLPEDFRVLGLSSSEGAGSRQVRNTSFLPSHVPIKI